MAEQWRDIANFKGYQVSSLGRVRSLDRTVLLPCGQTRSYKGRMLQPSLFPKTGHLRVSLGHRVTRQVHRLVAEAFHGPCPAGCEVLHKNEIPDDNRACNLKWGTRSENLKMDYASGARRLVPVIGIAIQNGKQVQFSSMREAAREVNGDASAIGRCCRGRRKTAYDCTWSYA